MDQLNAAWVSQMKSLYEDGVEAGLDDLNAFKCARWNPERSSTSYGWGAKVIGSISDLQLDCNMQMGNACLCACV